MTSGVVLVVLGFVLLLMAQEMMLWQRARSFSADIVGGIGAISAVAGFLLQLASLVTSR